MTLRQWDGLCRVTGLKPEFDALGARLGLDLGQEGDRFKAREEITALLAPWFLARKVEDFAEPFDANGVTWSVFRTFKQVVRDDPDVSTRHPMFSMLEQPGIGDYLVPGSPFEFSEFARSPPRRASVLGEHTDEILSGILGLSDHEISQLHEKGVVAGPRPQHSPETTRVRS
jgi:2-methylfumaryl-CoA isomerase